jgi:hypothetical protein
METRANESSSLPVNFPHIAPSAGSGSSLAASSAKAKYRFAQNFATDLEAKTR